MAKKKNKKSLQRRINDAKKALEASKSKPPRAGVHYTKVIKDKTKYSRKKKHKNEHNN